MNGTEVPLSNSAPASGAPHPEAKPGRRRSRRTTLILVTAFIVLVLLAIFLPPLVNLGHYRRSITASMSLALGRPVYVGGMQLRLLPTPGIVMTDFTVEEDPAFGYEPVLHANSVVASLRLTSLWRGRLEVSSISLDDASLNLVKNDPGDWNIASVLLRASQIPNAPTGERHPGEHLRFPYIEASDARINFKQGVEKKPFSLMNAEFAMWQASGGEWRIRLKAQPVRTDLQLHLSDTGLLTVEGSLRRAATLDAMPVSLDAEWSGAQLGQVSGLLAGFDSGWRGDLDATANLRGTAANLAVRSRLRVVNLRRQEFQPANTIDIDAACQGAWHHVEHSLSGLTCFWPVSTGHLLLTADNLSLAPLSGSLDLELNRIPAAFPMAALGLLRPRLSSLSAAGTVTGSFHLLASSQPTLSGHADATGIQLTSGEHTIPLPTLHFLAQSGAAPRDTPALTDLALQPVSIPFGAPQPLVADAHLTAAGFALHLTGQASLDRLTAAGADFGLLGNSLAGLTGKGRVELNTTTSGGWLSALASPVPLPATTGSIRLQNADLQPAFLHKPIHIDSADIFLNPQQLSWQNVLFHYRDLSLRASLLLPALCTQPQPCPATFTLHAPALDAGALEASLAAPRRPGLFGEILALGSAKASPWPPLHGTLQAATLQLGHLPVHNAAATIAIDDSTLSISSLDGSALGGTLHASGDMRLDAGTPHWTLTAQITGAHATEAGALFHQRWGTGTLTGDLKLTAAGLHLPELLDSAAGSFRATWQNGSLLSPAGAPLPLNRYTRWTAAGTLANRALTLTSGSILHEGRSTPVRGTIGFDRRLSLTFDTRKGPIRVAGTLAQPTVAHP